MFSRADPGARAADRNPLRRPPPGPRRSRHRSAGRRPARQLARSRARRAIFPDALPQVTFLSCLTWARLSCEPMEEATRAAAWIALNDAQHAILDAEAAARELLRLLDRLRLVEAAIAATVRLLPQGPGLDSLVRARRMARANASARADGGRNTSRPPSSWTVFCAPVTGGATRRRSCRHSPPPWAPTSTTPHEAQGLAWRSR